MREVQWGRLSLGQPNRGVGPNRLPNAEPVPNRRMVRGAGNQPQGAKTRLTTPGQRRRNKYLAHQQRERLATPTEVSRDKSRSPVNPGARWERERERAEGTPCRVW